MRKINPRFCMKIKSRLSFLALAWLTFSAFNPQSNTVFAQGSLAPTGAPAPAMKSLQQVEPRTDVLTLSGNANVQFIISQSGSYYLTTNITGVASKNGISIQADNVTLDLNGFTLFGGVTNSQAGISVNGAHVALAIRNGIVRDWPGNGIAAASASDSEFEQLRITANSGLGMKVGNHNLLADCAVVTNGGDGIDAGANCGLASCVVVSNLNGISTGSGCNLRDCTVNYNSVQGIVTGNNCLLTQSVAVYNINTEINMGNYCTLKDCNAVGGGPGSPSCIIMGNGCTMKDCTASACFNNGITVGTNCTLLSCTATANTGNADIYTGDGCVIKDCNAALSYYGFDTGDSCVIAGCSANDNFYGIGPGASSSVIGCNASSNLYYGISVAGSTLVKDNTTSSNDNGGFYASGSGNRIEGNLSANDNTGISVQGTENLIFHNTVTGAAISYGIISGNMVGGIASPPTSGAIVGSSGGAGLGTTDAWANFSY
jgi:hypothetical protein